MYPRLGDTLTRAQQWDNLIANYEWLNAHPLPDTAPPDTVAARNLVLAALVHAQNVLQSADQATADAAYQEAQTRYTQFVQQQRAAEMPSGFALWLSNLGLDIASPVAKLALGAAALIGAVVIIPPLLATAVSRTRGSRTLG